MSYVLLQTFPKLELGQAEIDELIQGQLEGFSISFSLALALCRIDG